MFFSFAFLHSFSGSKKSPSDKSKFFIVFSFSGSSHCRVPWGHGWASSPCPDLYFCFGSLPCLLPACELSWVMMAAWTLEAYTIDGFDRVWLQDPPYLSNLNIQHTIPFNQEHDTERLKNVNMFLERGYNMVQCGILLIYISVLLCPHWLPSTDLLVLGPSGHQIPHRRLMVVVYPALAVVAVLFLALLLVAMRSSQRNEPLKRTMTRRTSIKERWFFLRKWRISRVIIFFRVRVRPS